MELRRPRASEEGGGRRAGAAFLCLACDAGVHSANELASRHVRVPLDPFFDAAAAAGPVSTGSVPDFLATPADGAWGWREEDVEEAKSWLFPNPTKIAKGAEAEAGDAFWNEVDPFLEFECGGSTAICRINSECLVPVQAKAVNPPGKCFHVDFSTSANLSPPLSQSVSLRLRFEKTIRYASRKAYAEVRPRIKGRFAKRGRFLETEDESIAVDVHGITADAEYGVVPMFSHMPIN